jgi:hypothetical protein
MGSIINLVKYLEVLIVDKCLHVSLVFHLCARNLFDDILLLIRIFSIHFLSFK